MSTGVSFKIGADNSDGLKALKELRDEFKSLRNELKSAVTDIKIKVSADSAALGSEISTIKNHIKNQIGQIDVDVKVKADNATIAASAEQIKNQLRTALGMVDVALNLTANLASIQADIATIKNHIKTAIGSTDVKINIDIAHLQTQLAHIHTLIQTQLSSAGSTINLNLNTGTLETTIRNTVAALIKALRQLRDEIITLKSSLAGLGGQGAASATQLAALQRQVDSLRNQLDQLRNSTNQNSNSSSNFSNALGNVKSQIIGIIGAYAGLSGASVFINVTDEAKKFDGQLKLVTKSEQELMHVRQMLLEQSDETGTQMASSVELYTKIYNSTRNLNGASNDLLLRVTDITNKFVAIGGSSGESANAALVQFAQAMASGVLRGEELNSVMEQAPGLSKGLADGLGVSIGQLRKMAENGELTTNIVINALLKMGKVADEQFLKMPRQATQATTAIKNDLKAMVSELDKEWGFSKGLIESLELLRLHLPEVKQLILDLVDAAKIAGAALLLAFGAPALIQAIRGLSVLIAALRLQLFALSVQAGTTGAWTTLIAVLRSTQAAVFSLKTAFGVFSAALIGYEFGTYLRNEFEIVETAGNKLGQWLAKFVVQWKNSWSEIKFHIDHISFKPKSAEQIKKEQQEFFQLLKNNQAAYDSLNEDLPLQREQQQNNPTGDKSTNVDNAQVSNKPVNAEIDQLQKRIILVKAIIDAEDDYTAKKRGAIVELGQLEIEVLKNKLKKVQTDGKAQGEIQNEILEQELKNKQELSNFDKGQNKEKQQRVQILSTSEYDYQKKLIDQQYKDNEQLYKSQEINFNDYHTVKNNLNKKNYEVEISYLDQQALKATQHERKLLEYKQKNIKIEADERAKALDQEITEYLDKMRKDTQVILDVIADNNIEILNLSDFEKSLSQVSKQFEKSKEKVADLRKALGEKFEIDIELPDGSTLKLSKELIDGLQNQLNKQQFEIEAKIKFTHAINQIQKDVDKILSDKQYYDQYFDIQEKQNPMKKLEIDNARRQNAKNSVVDLQTKRNNLIDLQNSPEAANMKTQEIEELTDKIRNLDIAIQEMNINSATAFQEFSVNFKQAAGEALASGINNFFNDLIDGSKSAGEALRDFVRNFIKAIAQIIVQALAAYAALVILNAIPGGAAVASALDLAAKANNANKAVKSVKSAQAVVQHTGGITGVSGGRRNIDLATYSHAPRYHTGGVAGFAPNEVPAILERGEEVLTRNDPRHVANGGAAGNSVTVKNINVFTEEQAIEHMNSPAGERAQINMVQRNASAIKRILEDS